MSFFDFGPLFGATPGARKPSNQKDDDEPVIIDIETNGDEPHAAAGSGMSFFDFGPLFGATPGARKPSNQKDDDEPVIIDIETNGDEPHAAAGSDAKPPTGAPRIARQAKQPSHGRGSRVLIAVVAVIAVVVALFFAVANFAARRSSHRMAAARVC